MENFHGIVRGSPRTNTHRSRKIPPRTLPPYISTPTPATTDSGNLWNPSKSKSLVGFRDKRNVKIWVFSAGTRGRPAPHPAIYVGSGRTLLGEMSRGLLTF